MAKSVIGVEITEESVRAVEVSQGRTPQIVTFGEVALPPDAAKDSEVLDPGAVSVAIRQLWTNAKFRSKTVTLGVASRRILVREYTTTAMRPDLLRQALPFQVQDLLPVPVSQAVLDYYPTSQEGDQVTGLLVAAVSETIEKIMATFGRAKIRVSGVDLTAFGLARAAHLVNPAGTVAVVYAGDHTTQVVVTRDGVPDFVRIIPVDLQTAAVRRRTGEVMAPVVVPEPEESLVLSGGVRPRGGLRSHAADRPVADFIARVRSTLAFYQNRPTAQPFDQVLISGAGVGVDGLVESLATGIESPLRAIGIADLVFGRGAAPAGDLSYNLVSTLGLALGTANGKDH
ncbi:type IV pilus biogenesis protein PilM [Microbacterium mangrovi]|uniref:type IV pilus biogenesis protein PilM n=1 Tax=Microbacterium mangrovi TaxID=1348253 RepID=UPI00068FEA3D|nr:pilus assembly protein PilM [Microbacterium mangrovi]